MALKQLLALLAFLALVAVSCGDSDDGDADGAAATTEQTDTAGDDGDGEDAGGEESSGGGGSTTYDLGEFPIPAPPVGSDLQKNELDDIIAYNIWFPATEFEAVIAFYDEWTASEADEYQRVEAQSGGVSWLRTSGPEGRARTILVSAPIEGDDQTFVTLTDGAM